MKTNERVGWTKLTFINKQKFVKNENSKVLFGVFSLSCSAMYLKFSVRKITPINFLCRPAIFFFFLNIQCFLPMYLKSSQPFCKD